MKAKASKKKSKAKGIAERKTQGSKKEPIHYRSIALGGVLWLFITWLFFGSGIVRHVDIAVGQLVPSTIVSSVDIEVVNLTETAFNRTKAASSIDPVFTINPSEAYRTTKVVETLLDRLSELSSADTNQQSMIVSSIDDLLLGHDVASEEIISIFPANQIQPIKSTLTENMQLVMNAGVLSDEYLRNLFRESPDRTITIQGTEEASRTVTKKELYSTKSALQTIIQPIQDPAQREVLSKLLTTLIEPNMAYDEVITQQLRDQAVEAVTEEIDFIPAGTTLARAGDSATQQILLRLQAHEKKRQEERAAFDQALEIAGNGLLLLAGLIISIVILRVVAPKILSNPGHLLLLIILSLFTLGSARLLTYLSTQYALIPSALVMYLVPHALAILLAGILLGSRAAVCLGIWTSLATAILFDQSLNVFILGSLISITATSTARNVHRRSSLFKAGLWIGAISTLFALSSALLNRPAMSVLVGQLVASVIAAMLSIVFTLMLIPLFEKLFKITTDITLLELSDMGHPLLQKMAIQAPGTYHHSLMVATLAQNAAEAIGANSLLIRVCAYYHDIGKMAKPEFFTENIQHKDNPHDELSPHMSSLVIISHVKEGLALAKINKLPQPILDAIEQHHGNGLIAYFYHKAKVQQQTDLNNENINDSDFRYGGAPAISAEMAILSLADASEAAARSIEKPTPKKIASMIDSIFAGKIKDGQLNYSKLTMAEINIVKESFVFSLSNMLHGRIPYPKDDDDNKSNKPARKTSDSPSESPSTD